MIASGPSCMTLKTEKRKHLTVEVFLFLLEKVIEWDGRGEDGISREVFFLKKIVCSL